MGFTEFSYFASKSGAPFPDPDTPEGKDIKHMLETAAAQPGAGRIYWGHAVEKPHRQWLFLDWDSVEEHLAYRTTPGHDVVAKSMSSYLDWTDGYIKHIVTKPWPPTILAEAPVTEVLTLFFPAELEEPAKEDLSKQLEVFKVKALDTSSDSKGIAYGWSKENDVPITGEDGKAGNLLVAFIGWPSVEAHLKFRETEAFRDNIGLLREMKGIVKLGIFHVACRSLSSTKKK
ncbi:hypothetical protein COL26b_006188 [Colletotrichum chrysophilum]|uniref:uncharacterized protein n=1 Tax=Colletotrichum chrysophilum TaxID=1836956 RepID=UPI0023019F5E|nr:uncharacterized protein COL26b_006188 [Colletotrichum chrysophilum]KAJ0375681.1 hypothetical protein COL26b_006188 [Colletotrichum chrysophilum]